MVYGILVAYCDNHWHRASEYDDFRWHVQHSLLKHSLQRVGGLKLILNISMCGHSLLMLSEQRLSRL